MRDGLDMFYLQRVYWAVVGGAVAVAFMVHVLNHFIYWHRTSARSGSCPAKPKSTFFKGYATLAAMTREIANSSIKLRLHGGVKGRSEPLGKTILNLGNLLVVLALCFYGLDTKDHWQWEDIAYRTGYIAATQLPLLVLLAGKRNIIGFLVGSSYERLNWLHRWTARTLFLTATIHMGFWFRSWARYNYITRKLRTDGIAQRGLAAWCILLWIFLTSFAPVRRWSYEFFVIQHVMTMIGFLVAVFLHLPVQQRVCVWLPIGFYATDRLVRFAYVLYTNFAIFHPGQQHQNMFTCEAKVTAVGSDMSKIVIVNPPFKWRPGQHVFFSCHGIVPLQSHPFTIASIPEDGQIELLIKRKAGATKRIFSRAQACQRLPSFKEDLEKPGDKFIAILDGPYGCMRPLAQFDSLFLIAGGSGASFTIPLMKAIINGWKKSANRLSTSRTFLTRPERVATRYIRFVWVVKSMEEVGWFTSQLHRLASEVADLRKESHNVNVKVHISIYLTCDTRLEEGLPRKATSSGNARQDAGTSIAQDEKTPFANMCGNDKKCCCTSVIEDEDGAKANSAKRTACNCATLTTEKTAVNEEVSMSSTTKGTNSDLGEPRFEEKSAPLIESSINFVTGRPQTRNLIRSMLERACGESAVAVCGPQGLNDDVRNSVVTLSDERATHKGTGAQGIYFWEESFCY